MKTVNASLSILVGLAIAAVMIFVWFWLSALVDRDTVRHMPAVVEVTR